MWATNYKWLWILSSIPDPYSTFYDSTYLFDCCYYPLMTIVCYQPFMAVLALGRMVSFINIGHSSYNEFHSDYSSKPSFSLGYTPFALWTSPQWNRICEWSVIVLSTTNKRIISLSLTCKRNTTCNLYCFQNNTQVSFSNAFPLFLRYNHPTKSTSFTRVFNTIMHWYHHHITYLQLKSHHGIILFIPSTFTVCSRSIW